ncbi:hypothetical protein X777_09511 [Ooceraea biroi]|uniref:Uncharacterized protein n=1 Tax=Ooceraea biroi TaxID=2015173 RepID=A0A026W6R9_OOCBI|nr:hypothetical protein X777_09511 [Ooceraea biroi]
MNTEIDSANAMMVERKARRNESQIVVWHPAGGGIWCGVTVGEYVRWSPRKPAPLLSPDKPNCRFQVTTVTLLSSVSLFSPRCPKEGQPFGNASDIGYKPPFLRSVPGVR